MNSRLSLRVSQTCLLFQTCLSLCFIIVSVRLADAGSAIWLTTPVSSDWNNALNWSAGGPPNGAADVATFKTSNITTVTFSAFTTVDGIIYDPGASAYTTTPSNFGRLFLDGVGITNNSGIIQKFVTDATAGQGGIQFSNSASAGTSTQFTNSGGTAAGQLGGFIQFLDSATAANGTYDNKGGAVSGAFGGFIEFNDTATAANGTFTNEAAVSGGNGGFINFFNNSTGGSATFVCNGGNVSSAGGGYIHFFNSSSAGAGTLIANGGTNGGLGSNIQFQNDSTGGTVRLEIFGDTLVDCFNHSATTPLTVGSLEGDGSVSLFGTKLTVGGNNLSTTYSGVISDGGLGGTLTKVGRGRLTLAGANTYTGGTTVNTGSLFIKKSSGSGTGTGSVQVNGGTLGGTGQVSGNVTIGNGTGPTAFLAPGINGIGTFTTQKKLTFQADSTYNFEANSNTAMADQAKAKGVTIASGALFSFFDLGAGTLTAGTAFTAINNTASSPIAGVFSNLADGGTVTVGSNTYLVDYQGGTGNDLTLTVQ